MAWAAADAKLEHYMVATQELKKELEEYDDSFNHLTWSYKGRTLLLVEDTKLDNYMIEHYQESPSYNSPYAKEMIDTLIWMSYSDEDKKKMLDGDMDTHYPQFEVM
jgi:hypothetical protein